MRECDNIVAMIRSGDIASFELLYDIHYSALLAFSRSFIHDKIISQDVVQDSFMAIWQQRESLTNDTNIKNYLFTVVRNKSITQLREMIKSRKTSIESLTAVDYFLQRKLMSLEEMNSSVIDVENINRNIENIFNSLPKIYQEVFKMSREGNLNYNQIASELNISVKTVEKRMSTTLKVFRTKLGNNYCFLFFY